MSVLADALQAAQARAAAAVGKAFVAGRITRGQADTELAQAGCSDETDRAALLDALELVARYGAGAPAEPKPQIDRSKITDAQVQYIGRLVKEKQVEPPDLAGLNRDQASKLIGELQNGTYDPAAWSIPF